MEKRRAISPLFYNIFNISLTSAVKLHIHLLNVVVRFIVSLTSATLICRGTDISKCFRESLLYIKETRIKRMQYHIVCLYTGTNNNLFCLCCHRSMAAVIEVWQLGISHICCSVLRFCMLRVRLTYFYGLILIFLFRTHSLISLPPIPYWPRFCTPQPQPPPPHPHGLSLCNLFLPAQPRLRLSRPWPQLWPQMVAYYSKMGR